MAQAGTVFLLGIVWGMIKKFQVSGFRLKIINPLDFKTFEPLPLFPFEPLRIL